MWYGLETVTLTKHRKRSDKNGQDQEDAEDGVARKEETGKA